MNGVAAQPDEDARAALAAALRAAVIEAKARGYPHMADLLDEYLAAVMRIGDGAQRHELAASLDQALTSLEVWRSLGAPSVPLQSVQAGK